MRHFYFPYPQKNSPADKRRQGFWDLKPIIFLQSSNDRKIAGIIPEQHD
jgi:hypothetical protein